MDTGFCERANMEQEHAWLGFRNQLDAEAFLEANDYLHDWALTSVEYRSRKLEGERPWPCYSGEGGELVAHFQYDSPVRSGQGIDHIDMAFHEATLVRLDSQVNYIYEACITQYSSGGWAMFDNVREAESHDANTLNDYVDSAYFGVRCERIEWRGWAQGLAKLDERQNRHAR